MAAPPRRRARSPADLERVAEPYRLQLAGQLDEAAAAWGRSAAPYDQALALLDTGTPELLRPGLDLLDRLGADARRGQVPPGPPRRGVTDVPARPAGRDRANAAGLTARQVEVLALLADGLHNAELAPRLYISPKTADHHVSADLVQAARLRQPAQTPRAAALKLRIIE